MRKSLYGIDGAPDDQFSTRATSRQLGQKVSDAVTLNLEAKLTVWVTRPFLNVPVGMRPHPLLSFHLASPSAVKRQL